MVFSWTISYERTSSSHVGYGMVAPSLPLSLPIIPAADLLLHSIIYFVVF